MRRRISDHDIEQLLSGRSPGDPPELLAVTEILQAARCAAYEKAVRPSALLAARLDVSDEVSATGRGEPVAQGEKITAWRTATERIPSSSPRRVSVGLVAKVSLGFGALALGMTSVGVAGALPAPIQTVFDSAVQAVIEDSGNRAPVNGAETVDESLPIGGKEFSTWVREGAQDPDKVGSEFGAVVSEQARELREEKAAERAEERAELGKPPIGKPARDESVETIDSDKPDNPRNENAPGGKP